MKSIELIYSDMIDNFEEKSGLSLAKDGDMALRFYAIASEIASLWTQLDYTIRQSFPQTAVGELLDFHAENRGLFRLAKTKATGTIRFYLKEALSSDLTIPKGTCCLNYAGLEFETTESGLIEAGDTFCDCPCQSKGEGERYNAPSLSVCFMSLPPVGVSSCINLQSFEGGSDGESDDELRKRLLESFSSLPNGSNAAYYKQLVQSVLGVAGVCVKPKERGLGTVDIVISALESYDVDDLVDAVQDIIDREREICVDAVVSSADTESVNLSLELEASQGYDFDEVKLKVQDALNGYFSGKLLGQNIRLAKLASVIFGVEGVYNYKILSPSADVSVDSDVLPVLGTLSISEV